ncbi:hypothetical protein HID58_089899 [Brassica napus]|uniref:Uncharacterized protein n=1 Tax=Brassica napus TaxID=3708 RepID=A0ABQ7Y0D8_BRANA|nr:hypothetical protein HID58_089899 [Brassica napus]
MTPWQPTIDSSMNLRLDTYKFTDMTVITQHIDPLTCIVAQFNSKKHMVNEKTILVVVSALQRKYGKPHQEFVKILCTYKDIFELRKRVEAFDLQYEMHASSYQRDCLRNWMLDSASGYFYNQTNELNQFLSSCGITLIMKKRCWVTQDEAYYAVKENVARGNQEKRA